MLMIPRNTDSISTGKTPPASRPAWFPIRYPKAPRKPSLGEVLGNRLLSLVSALCPWDIDYCTQWKDQMHKTLHWSNEAKAQHYEFTNSFYRERDLHDTVEEMKEEIASLRSVKDRAEAQAARRERVIVDLRKRLNADLSRKERVIEEQKSRRRRILCRVSSAVSHINHLQPLVGSPVHGMTDAQKHYQWAIGNLTEARRE